MYEDFVLNPVIKKGDEVCLKRGGDRTFIVKKLIPSATGHLISKLVLEGTGPNDAKNIVVLSSGYIPTHLKSVSYICIRCGSRTYATPLEARHNLCGSCRREVAQQKEKKLWLLK